MARETKSISVSPNSEQDAIEIWQVFGWELVSSQEIFNKDTHKETRSDGVYNVTTTTNYVKLVFSRETTIPNYAQIVALEKEYESIQDPPYKPPFGMNLLQYAGGALGLLGFIGLAMGGGGAPAILMLVAGIALFVTKIVISANAEVKHDAVLSKVRAQRAAVLKKVMQVNNQ